MPTERTGYVEPCKDAKGRLYYRARIHLADGTRPRFRVPDERAYSEERAREWAAWLQEREDATGEILAATRERRAREGRRAPADRAGETVADWTDRWLKDRRARGLSSVDTDGGRLRRHVLPLLARKAMASVTRADIEDVRDALDAKVTAALEVAKLSGARPRFNWKTAINAWGLITRMFRDASASKNRDLRVREDDPTKGVEAPERGAKTGKVYLYPDEFLKLVSCADVPLKWRRLYAVTTYLYARAAEVKGLEWADTDGARGIVHIHKTVDRRTGKEEETKTGASRRLPIEPALAPLLEAMRAEKRGPRVIADLPDTDRKLARQLRHHLQIAGVERRELLHSSPTTKPVTFHDLRATGITWCAVRGDDPLRIKQRAGHSTFSTTEGYIREAENLREAFGDVFPPLPAALLEQPTKSPTRSQLCGRIVEPPGIEADGGCARNPDRTRDPDPDRRPKSSPSDASGSGGRSCSLRAG